MDICNKAGRVLVTLDTSDDSRSINLSGVDLRCADLTRRDLSNAVFDGANLSEADFTGADVSGATFNSADLSYSRFNFTSARWTHFRNANLAYATFILADIVGANFNDANLQDVYMQMCKATEVSFIGANITNTHFCYTDLSYSTFEGARGAADFYTSHGMGTFYDGVPAEYVDGGARSDGYKFALIDGKVRAGCRNYTIAEAMEHWDASNYRDAKRGAESRAIIKHMIDIADQRGYRKHVV